MPGLSERIKNIASRIVSGGEGAVERARKYVSRTVKSGAYEAGKALKELTGVRSLEDAGKAASVIASGSAPEYPELRAYIYGAPASYEVLTPRANAFTSGPSKASLSGGRDLYEYDTVMNPDGEYLFPESWRGVLDAAANAGRNIYFNTDRYNFANVGQYGYDGANHPIRLSYGDDGQMYGSAADVFDFDLGYAKRYAVPEWQVKAMSAVGTPYIVRQDDIPVRFIPDNDVSVLGERARSGADALVFGETGDMSSEYKAVDNILSRSGLPSIQPSLVEADAPDYLRGEYASGGDIHIKKSHRGRLTELKKRTGKTEAELYNDGNPAHKRMVVFARNSRRWKK